MQGSNLGWTKKDILPGEQWKSRIPQAIRCSDFFLVCLSANSVDKRGWIQKEIKEALDTWQEMLDSDIYLIPVRLEDCRVPEGLSAFQWVNLFEEDSWTRLMEAIRVGLERRARVIKQKTETIAKGEGIRHPLGRELKLQAPSETPLTPEARRPFVDVPKPTSPQQLSPWNPLDHLRLLWWVLVTPRWLKAYRETFGEKAERGVGKWLVSTLIWVPLSIPVLAMGLGILPNTEGDYSLSAYLLTIAVFVFGWVLTSLLDEGC